MEHARSILPSLIIATTLVACGSSESAEESPAVQPFFEIVVPDVTVELPEPDPDIAVDPGPCAGKEEGEACDDGDLCTLGDRCVGGFCVPQSALECDSQDDPCRDTICLPESGCSSAPRPDGATCVVPCFAAGRCESGTCVPDPTTETQCEPSSDPCVSSVACNPSDGECNLPLYALSCPDGTACRSEDGALRCVDTYPWLCRPCEADADCADTDQPTQVNLCVDYGPSGRFCGGDCTVLGCPDGYECQTQAGTGGTERAQCVRTDGVCACLPEWSSLGFQTTCRIENDFGACSGSRACVPGGLTPCSAAVPSAEVCDGVDNDCDGVTDITDGCGPAGACCLGPGQCGESFQTSCSLQGGTYQGIGVGCENAACGGNTEGACCQADGTCTAQTLAVCLAIEGQYLGDGLACEGIDCTAPPGLSACCRANGSCSFTTPVNCTLSDGVYQGEGTNCVETTCPVLGACCLGDTSCIDVSQADCDDIGGAFTAVTSCSETQCLLPPGLGACCLEGASCVVMAIEDCEGQALEGEQCVGQCSAPTLGACCAPLQQGCTQVQIQDCPPTHQWKGANTSCTDACEEETGVCCKSGNCFPGLTEAQCAEVSGTYAGPDATCDACN